MNQWAILTCLVGPASYWTGLPISNRLEQEVQEVAMAEVQVSKCGWFCPQKLRK